MIASVAFLSVLVTVALAVTAVAPVVLIALLLRDHFKGRLW